MSCDQYTDLIELFAIGSLERDDSDAVRSHLAGGCETCAARLDEALVQAALITSTVPLMEPPASLRDRIAASAGGSKRVVMMPTKKRAASSAPWWIAAAAAAALVAGIGYEEKTRREEVAGLTASLNASNADAQRTAQMLTILEAPGTKQVALNLTNANLPQGTLFIHKNLGVAMVLAHMPAAPEGWKYESWIVPKSGAPQPVESFATNKSGVAITVVKGPVDITQWTALAVSVEPQDSTPVKPTKVVFAAPV
jgi:hypothetical protein